MGSLINFRLLPGQRFDSITSGRLGAELNDHGARMGISQHPARARKLWMDADIRTRRHFTENFFCKF